MTRERVMILGNFKFAGADTVELAKKYGTPLYIMSEDFIVERCREIREDFLEKHENTRAVYASKAFLTKEMVRILMREKIGMDAVSGGEIYLALSVGFPAEEIIFHGNNKTKDELRLAIGNGVGRIVVDSLMELELIDQVTRELDRSTDILFRITPGLESDTHKFIQTAQVDSKFGIPLDDGIICRALDRVLESDYINFKGFHFHIGSQLLNNSTHLKAVDILMELMKEIEVKYGLESPELNTGGGYGIKYTDEQRQPLSYFTDRIVERVDDNAKRLGIKRPKIIIEPGRWLVGEAGMTLYEIGNIKEIPNVRTYVSIDGGMPDNIRPSLYDAKYDAIVLNKPEAEKTEKVTISGKCCESGDILIWDLMVPSLERGDYLGVFSTGAYNYTMASNYNRIGRPAVVFVRDGEDRLVVKRETYEDLLRNEI